MQQPPPSYSKFEDSQGQLTNVSPSPVPQQQFYAPPTQQVINMGQQPGPMMVGGFHKFAKESISTTCFSCNNQIMTNVRTEMTGAGYAYLIICLFFLFWPALLLLCIPFFRRFYHSCPRCGAQVGVGEHSLTGRQIAIIVGVSLISCCWLGIVIWAYKYNAYKYNGRRVRING